MRTCAGINGFDGDHEGEGEGGKDVEGGHHHQGAHNANGQRLGGLLALHVTRDNAHVRQNRQKTPWRVVSFP